MDKLSEIRKEIEDIIAKSPLDFDLGHARKTWEWVLKLKPDADEALQIAALGHDIDRAVTGITETYNLKDFSQIDEFKRQHALRSAEIMAEFLRNHSFEEDLIKKVERLVENHEVGGDDETDILLDADSIAYFDGHVGSYYQKNGRDKARNKIGFMYKRVSPQAKEIIKNLSYQDEAIKEIVAEVAKESNP